MRPNRIGIALGVAAALGALGASAKPAPYRPRIDPAHFQATVNHPYFPLVPGTVARFVDVVGTDTSLDEVTVTGDTKVVMGITCVVVRDRLTHRGKVREDSFDWYAQDKQGNVWYFGEDTREFLPGGRLTTEGSWQAGVNRAQPGIIMPAKPAPGSPPYREEYGPGHAEDMGQIIAIHESVSVPYGRFQGCVRTKEWSRLEPGIDRKWYTKGVGLVREETAEHEHVVLVSVTHP
jgi:hypothetical protein